MTKAELRREYLSRLKKLDSADAAALSRQICNQLFDSVDFSRFEVVHTFLPIQKNNEVNTWLIVKRLQTEFPNVRIVVPRTHPTTYSMTSHLFTEQTVLTETRWGVLEPEPINHVEPTHMDCVLMPFLAYDQKGYRVGYGKGFYDRFLAQCRADVQKIGLSYFEPVAKIEDTDEYDIPLNCCVTPEKVWNFKTLQGF